MLRQTYENWLDEYGPDSQAAVGWFKEDADTRYRVMLGVMRVAKGEATLLDLGCGMAGLLDYIERKRIRGIRYVGLDASERFLAIARQRHPDADLYLHDFLGPDPIDLPVFDYVVMNGIFTYKGDRTDAEMMEFLRSVVPRAFKMCGIGLAFNVHSTQVDWERDDLYHLSVDQLLGYLASEVSRHVVIRHDYGLYEYTAYVYREPSDPEQAGAKRLVSRVDERALPG